MTPSTMPSRRRLLLRLGGSAVTLGLLLLILPFDELMAALGSVPAAIWIGAISVYLCLHLLGVAKWRLLLNGAGAGLSFRDAVRCYYMGLFGNIFLPSIVGGDVVRAGLAFRLARSRSAIVFGSLVDRVIDLVALVAVAVIGIVLLPTALDDQSRRVFLMMAGMCGAAGLLAFVVLLRFKARRHSWKVRRLLVKTRRAVRELWRRPQLVVSALLLGISLQTLLVVLNMWIGREAGIDIAFVIWLFVWPMAKISGLAPITQGGIGVREAAQVALFAPFGVSAVPAAATALVFEAVIITGGLIGGGIALLLRRSSETPSPETPAEHGASVAAGLPPG
jgi:uncharacterized membrane protein YbhN (UPF0104 family)